MRTNVKHIVQYLAASRCKILFHQYYRNQRADGQFGSLRNLKFYLKWINDVELKGSYAIWITPLILVMISLLWASTQSPCSMSSFLPTELNYIDVSLCHSYLYIYVQSSSFFLTIHTLHILCGMHPILHAVGAVQVKCYRPGPTSYQEETMWYNSGKVSEQRMTAFLS